MARTALSLVIVAGLSAWAAAQAVPTAAEQARLFERNRDLLQTLLSDGLAAADDGPLTRIAACRQAARTLSRALDDACQMEEPDRVAELGDHLGDVLADGLVPALASARTVYTPGSPGYEEFQKLDADSAADARTVAGLIPAAGKLGDRPDVRAARGKLTTAAGRVAP